MSWEALHGAVAAARAELAAAAPDAATAAEAEAYVARVLAACLADGFLPHLFTQDGLTRPLPTRGGPNPDYLMSHAGVDPARTYRIEGRLNDSERVGIGLYSIGAGGAVLLAGYATFDRANVAADGGFALELAAGAQGPGTLAVAPDARVLIVRVLHRDPHGTPSRVALTGGPPPPGLAVAGGDSAAALVRAGQVLLSSVRQFIEWSGIVAAAPNRFIVPPPAIAAAAQGDPDTVYQLGGYALAEGEWLEAVMPEGLAGYWSLHAYNHWCEPLPGAGVHDLSARPDPDGRIRLRIGPTVPDGVANRIDTQGRRRGMLIGRVIGTAGARLPETRVMGSSDR